MSEILIFKETVLPKSETFILAQMQALRNVSARLIGLEEVPAGLPLPSKPILLCRARGGAAALRAKIYRKSGIAPLFHAKARQERPALLHAHFASGGLTAIPLARSLGVPLLVTLHGSDVTVKWASAESMRRLGREAALFLCVSHFIRERAIAAGLPGEKLRVHYIGVDLQQFQAPPTGATGEGVLFVGRLVEKKGCAYLLRAMASVQQTYPDCLLTVIGDGPLRGSLESHARELGVACRFLGAQPTAIVREHLQQTRIFCAPSVTAENGDSEGLGMVFAEAQAMGIPVVSSLHGGIPEVVVHGRTGLLVNERDDEALAAAIASLLGDASLWEQFRHSARAHIEHSFDLAKQTAELETIYQDLMATASQSKTRIDPR
jgi:colanic acid/amylovoran biosynthesis glycosyltransferase